MCTWNERRTVQLAMESTKDFVDRYIIVDKGSDDGTIEAIEECKDKWQLNVDVYVKPGLWLGEARLFAFNSADEEWILVQDGDEIFHTDGPNSIYNLRKFLKFQDVVYAAPMNVLCGDFLHTNKNLPRQPPHSFLYHNNKTFYIERRGDLPEMMGIEIVLPRVYKFNCGVKSPKRVFLRQYWFEWCVQTDAFKRYDNVEEYVKAKLKIRDLEVLAKQWYENVYSSMLMPYEENKYGYYPKVIRKAIAQGLIRGYDQDRLL
jgi:glycosyltransferase involved in cell wall biosynthesis